MNTNIKNRYLNMYLTMKNKRENTIKQYTSNLNDFYEYFNNVYRCESEIELLKSIDNDDLEDYILYLIDNKKFSANTVNSKISTLQSFYSYIVDNKNIVPYNIAKNIPYVSEERTHREVKSKELLSKEEIDELINATYKKVKGERGHEISSARMRFIIALSVTTGMRIQEVLGLEENEIEQMQDREGYFINISYKRVKNKLDKRVPITGTVLKYFNEWMEERKKLGVKDKYIIVSNRGKKLSTKDYNKALEKLVEKTNINKHITSHCARVSFANILASKDVDENMIKRIGGWKINGVMENVYCRDISYDRKKIQIAESIL